MPPLLRWRTPGNSLFLLSALVVLWAGSACGPSGMGPTPTSMAASAPDTPTTASVPSATAPVPTATPAAPCTLGLAIGDGLPAIESQTSMSVAIAIVTVERLLPARWDTSDGARPSNPCAQRGPPYYRIFTPVLVRVERYVRGELQERDLLLSWEVGQVGVDRQMPGQTDGYTMDGYREGERLIVFLRPAHAVAPIMAGVPLWDSSFRYIITPGQMVTVRERESFSRRTIPLEQLLAEIDDVR
jgi:hypothetical protein